MSRADAVIRLIDRALDLAEAVVERPRLLGTTREAWGAVLDVATRLEGAGDGLFGPRAVNVREEAKRLVELVRIGLADLDERPQGGSRVPPHAGTPASMNTANVTLVHDATGGGVAAGPTGTGVVSGLAELAQSWDEIADDKDHETRDERLVWHTCARQLRRLLDGRDSG